MKKYIIEFYKTKKDFCPVEEWLNGIDSSYKKRILRRLQSISFGNLGDRKILGDGIYELRFFFGSGYRIYYGLQKDILVILLNAGDKNSQRKDIEKAKQYWEEYKERSKNDYN